MGLGSIGMRHARNFRSLGTELIGFDPSPERRANFEGVTKAPASESEDYVLSQVPDLVVISSPNVFHLPQATKAVDAGCKALFVEKPLGTDLAAAIAFRDLVNKSGTYVHVGSNWKFHPAFRTMKRWLDDGRIGVPTGAQVLAGQWLPDWHPWEDYRNMYSSRLSLGGGAIYDTHELDYLCWLLGKAKRFVGFSSQSGALEIETEDVAVCMIQFQSGALGTLLTDYIQRVGRRAYHISGPSGSIDWDIRTNKLIFSESKRPDAEVVDTTLPDINDMYVRQSERILSDIQSGAEPMTGIDSILHVMTLQSQWHSQTPLSTED